MILVLVLGLSAAVLLAFGFVLQQHAAAQAPPEERLSPRLLLDLARRPLWLGGIAAMVAGQVLGGSALGRGDVGLVEPLLAANLLFALPIAATWSRRRLGTREWTGAVLLIIGLAGFVIAGAPEGDQDTPVGALAWAVSGGCVAAVATVVTVVAKRRAPAEEATLLAVAAGVLYGFQDILTRRTLLLWSHGALLVLTSWQPYVLVTVAIVGLTLSQSAFEAAPLAASLPALTIAEPLTGIALGASILGEHLRLSALPFAGELAALGFMVAGVILVARSPLVAAAASPSPDTA